MSIVITQGSIYNMNKRKIVTGLISFVTIVLFFLIIFTTNIVEYAKNFEDKIFLSVLFFVLIMIVWDEYNRRY